MMYSAQFTLLFLVIIILYIQLRDNYFNIPFFYYFCTILSTIYFSVFYTTKYRQMSFLAVKQGLFG